MASVLDRFRTRDGHQLLRQTLKFNAAFSTFGGITAIVLGSQLGDRFDVNEWLVRSVGAALLVFAAQVLFVASRPESQMVPLGRAVSVADATWVVASIVVIVSGLVSTFGAIVLGMVAAAVADFAATQLWATSRIGHGQQVAQTA